MAGEFTWTNWREKGAVFHIIHAPNLGVFPKTIFCTTTLSPWFAFYVKRETQERIRDIRRNGKEDAWFMSQRIWKMCLGRV
jgi:hypothetical protein